MDEETTVTQRPAKELNEPAARSAGPIQIEYKVFTSNSEKAQSLEWEASQDQPTSCCQSSSPAMSTSTPRIKLPFSTTPPLPEVPLSISASVPETNSQNYFESTTPCYLPNEVREGTPRDEIGDGVFNDQLSSTTLVKSPSPLSDQGPPQR
ncbi:hypothetical protein MJO28_007216 [Puccinia striiformis f. sp. tritici]|uniref:Uncharacterized protein n=3 Tax=Puccinia striiformis TaxID=27350 RepID=A0A0L0VBT4_9BASI|nr:hypothetical protein MJO28_017758 [Puccinia striiformis f. sp. tritici]KAI7951532.1 hypothetical protein MJO28_007216 [Puccinia striiformis f. sp. tritici]KAI7955769.1 hypothetical protein MJO29_007168 [Puccinia striiformis f. sp. tritici]KNE96728.1 hypothetical protein PSTG_09999 [Puccinia striiformis f. sp. tritici PST-78]POW22308.1 hypothetical protein PSHT_01468 [Puccinia striiformis]